MNTTPNYIIVPNEAADSMRQFNSIFVDVDGVLMEFFPSMTRHVFLPGSQEPLRVIGWSPDSPRLYAVCELSEVEQGMRRRRTDARLPGERRRGWFPSWSRV